MRTTLLFLAALLGLQLAAQHGRVSTRIDDLRASGARFTPVQLFGLEPATRENSALWNKACNRADVLRLDNLSVKAMLVSRPQYVSLTVPSAQGSIVLDLQQADAVTDGFLVRVASTGAAVDVPGGLHYRGTVNGVPGSIAAISVFDGEVMGLIVDADGERVIGKFDEAPVGLHVLYRAQDLFGTPITGCSALEIPGQGEHRVVPGSGGAKTMRCVKFYWEVAFDIFTGKGSVIAATNYVTGLFNQSAILFDNDGVDVQLQEVFVWDVASPYNGTSSGSRLSQFGTTRTSFNGDLAHLLDYGNYGGVAWLNSLCGSTSSRMAYSGINSTYNNVPTYSWSVMVVTHEQGHNLGSNHTHDCVWNGDNTRIDGCGPAAGYNSGSCAAAPVPPVGTGGTIMSYCHLLATGINLSNGFGPQPAQLIRDRVNGASCLAQCGTTCDSPGGRFANNLTLTSGTLNWANLGAASYDVRWRQVGAPAWNTITGITTNSHAISGLTQGTNYEFQVLSNCSGSSSAFSTSTNFTTPVPCPDAMEPNNTIGTAAAITPPANISALIATGTDQDHYSFTLASPGTINLYLSNLAGDYDLYLLSSGGTVLASGTNGGTSSEYVSYSATAGSYVVRVVGWNGAFSSFQCYNLSVSVSAPACGTVTGLNASSITSWSAMLGWDAQIAASSFDLDWKLVSGSVWTTVAGVTGSSYALTGLTANTQYHFRMKANCAQPGGQTQYGQPVSFTTTSSPCVDPSNAVVALKVFLEGPYKTGNGLMADSLRARGFLPLTEPYTAMGLAVTGPTAIANAVRDVTGNNAVVDWVAVELRDAGNNSSVVSRRAALVQRDGDVVDLDGTSALGFCVSGGNYFVAVRHRNHLGVMSSTAPLLSSSATSINFTLSGTATFGTDARKAVGAVMTLWMGNGTANNDIKYTGTANDRDPVLTTVGGTLPTNTVSGYYAFDHSMDGTVKYTGTENDRDPILVNVGGTVPTNVRVEQLP